MAVARWSLSACLATLTLGLRLTRSPAGLNVSLAQDCGPLKGLTIRDVNLGEAAYTVCKFWPKSRGEFPIEKVDKITEILEKGLGRGGIYDELKDLVKSRGRNAKFCWKSLELRNSATPHSSALAQLNVSATDSLDNSEALFFHRRRRRRGGVPAGCDVYTGGKCYGGCPSHFEPTKLIDRFAPLCKSDCRVKPYTRKCGFGCAVDTHTCVSVIFDQIKEVLNGVAGVAAYLTGNEAIGKVVEKLLQLAEFVIEVIFNVIKTAKSLWKSYKESESLAGFISLFYSFILEHADEIGQTVETAQKLFGDVVGFWFEMLGGGFEIQGNPIEKLAEAFSKYGDEVLDSAVQLVKAFVYPKCER